MARGRRPARPPPRSRSRTEQRTLTMRTFKIAGLLPVALCAACSGNDGNFPLDFAGVDQALTPVATYKVGGAASGLSGSGLVLELNGAHEVAVAASGAFTFPDALLGGAKYVVTVKTQP